MHENRGNTGIIHVKIVLKSVEMPVTWSLSMSQHADCKGGPGGYFSPKISLQEIGNITENAQK